LGNQKANGGKYALWSSGHHKHSSQAIVPAAGNITAMTLCVWQLMEFIRY